MKKKMLTLAVGLAVANVATAADFGMDVQNLLKAKSEKLFGFESPLASSETVSVSRASGQNAYDLIKLADGLHAQIVSRQVAQNSDQFALWPNDRNPTHLITCIEDFRDPSANVIGAYPSGQVKYGPSIQRVNLETGEVETILRGMSSCDGIRRTPWNTIVASEERDDGGLYEILNPLATTELTLVARGGSAVVDSNGSPVTGAVEYRGALGTLAWEGLDVTPQGVVYYGDEERPGTGGPDADGGALFKFVPSAPLNGASSISSLSQSPLASGNVYAYQASCQARTSSSFPQFGQGCEVGEGAWVKIDAANARVSANAKHATGFYRPEDGHFDPKYAGPGVRFCWTNTGNSGAKNYGEVGCLVDSNPLGAGEKTVASTGLTYLADPAQSRGFNVAEVNRLVEGDAQLNQPDNLAFQPGTGNVYVIEDQTFGDVWACLPDGADRDIKSDGCVRVLSVRDQSAEPTGFGFSGDGKTAYVHIQHSSDTACVAGTDCQAVDGYPTDDLIKITGFKVKK